MGRFSEDFKGHLHITRSFELQLLPYDIAEITNIPNDGIMCRGGENWWEELGAIKANVIETLMGKKRYESQRYSNVSSTYSC